MTNSISAKVAEMGFRLPEAATPVGNYTSRLRINNMLYISGQLPVIAGKPLDYLGCVYAEDDHSQPTGGCSLIEAMESARTCALNIIAQIAAEVDDDMDKVTRIVRLGGFVASNPTFTDQPTVINGASNMMVEVFGDDVGKHVRAAVGVSSLPLNAPVEIEATVLLKP